MVEKGITISIEVDVNTDKAKEKLVELEHLANKAKEAIESLLPGCTCQKNDGDDLIKQVADKLNAKSSN